MLPSLFLIHYLLFLSYHAPVHGAGVPAACKYALILLSRLFFPFFITFYSSTFSRLSPASICSILLSIAVLVDETATLPFGTLKNLLSPSSSWDSTLSSSSRLLARLALSLNP